MSNKLIAKKKLHEATNIENNFKPAETMKPTLTRSSIIQPSRLPVEGRVAKRLSTLDEENTPSPLFGDTNKNKFLYQYVSVSESDTEEEDDCIFNKEDEHSIYNDELGIKTNNSQVSQEATPVFKINRQDSSESKIVYKNTNNYINEMLEPLNISLEKKISFSSGSSSDKITLSNEESVEDTLKISSHWIESNNFKFCTLLSFTNLRSLYLKLNPEFSLSIPLKNFPNSLKKIYLFNCKILWSGDLENISNLKTFVVSSQNEDSTIQLSKLNALMETLKNLKKFYFRPVDDKINSIFCENFVSSSLEEFLQNFDGQFEKLIKIIRKSDINSNGNYICTSKFPFEGIYFPKSAKSFNIKHFELIKLVQIENFILVPQIASDCKSLEEIILKNFEIFNYIRIFLELNKFSNLKSVKIVNMKDTENSIQLFNEISKKSKNITNFIIESEELYFESNSITKSLNISKCFKILIIFEIFQNLREDFYENLTFSCCSLEKFTFGTTFLSKLNCLILSEVYIDSIFYLEKIIKNCRNLESLKVDQVIISNDNSFKFPLSIVETLLKLKHLTINRMKMKKEDIYLDRIESFHFEHTYFPKVMLENFGYIFSTAKSIKFLAGDTLIFPKELIDSLRKMQSPETFIIEGIDPNKFSPEYAKILSFVGVNAGCTKVKFERMDNPNAKLICTQCCSCESNCDCFSRSFSNTICSNAFEFL